MLGLQNVDYVFNAAHDLGDEIEFKPGGIIQTHAQQVLGGAHEMLERIAEEGLFSAIERASFGDVSRRLDEGRGIEGIVKVSSGYFNPLLDLMSRGQLCLGRSISVPSSPTPTTSATGSCR